MNPEQRKRLWVVGVFCAGWVLLLCWFPSLVQAGWYIVSTTTPLNSPPPAWGSPQVVTYVSQNRIKYETRAWTQIVDLAAQRLSVINHIGQVYWRGQIDAYTAVLAQRSEERRARAEQLMKRVPLGQRQSVGRRAGPFDSMAPTIAITITPTSEEESVAGYTTRKYLVLRNGEPYEETWLAGEIDLSTDLDMRRLKEFVDKLQTSRSTPPGAVLAELTQLVNTGYPVKTVNLVSHMVKEVIQAEHKNIPDDEFVVPNGYSQRALAEIMFPPRRRL